MCPLCTLKGTPNKKNFSLLFDQNFIYHFFGQTFSNTSQQTAPYFQQKNTQKDSSLFQKKQMIHP